MCRFQKGEKVLHTNAYFYAYIALIQKCPKGISVMLSKMLHLIMWVIE